MHARSLLSLIDTIYTAAADPSRWPHVAMEIQREIGGHSVNLALEDLTDSRVNIMFTNGVSQQQMENYQAEVMGKDEMTDLLNVVPECSSFATQDYFDLNTVRSLYCYEAFYEEVGYTHFNVGLFYRNNGRRAWLSVARSEADTLYSQQEQLLMQHLTPHLRRAFLINLQLSEAQLRSQLALDSLEHVSAAVMLITAKGQVVQHNRAAEPYLRHAGSSFKKVKVRLPEANASHKLQKLIAGIAKSGVQQREHSGVVSFYESGKQRAALCFPWHSSAEQQDWLGQPVSCIVFIPALSQENTSLNHLQMSFDLSKAELNVLKHLMKGHTVAEIATHLFVTEAAIRFQIRNLLRKTRCRNQAELISKAFNHSEVRIKAM